MGRRGPRIGVLGGTLDPVHHAHLFAAEEARVADGLDRVLIIPCGSPPHKDAGKAAAPQHRLAMCELAVHSNPYLQASALDLPNWYRPDEVPDAARCLVVPRPGNDLTALERVLGPERASRVEVLPVPCLEISATDIRRRVRV